MSGNKEITMRNKATRIAVTVGTIACMMASAMTSFAGQWKDCGAVWRYYTEDGQYRGWLDEKTGAKYFLNQYGDMAVGYQPLTADTSGTVTWHYFTEAEGENADAFKDAPTYGKLATGYQTVHGVNVYFSEDAAENGRLYTDMKTPDGRMADQVGILH